MENANISFHSEQSKNCACGLDFSDTIYLLFIAHHQANPRNMAIPHLESMNKKKTDITALQFHQRKPRSGMARMYGPDGQYMLNNVSEMVAPNVSHIYIHKSCLVC